MELRCSSKKHGVMLSDSLFEVKCDSRFCGARRGVVVLHRIDIKSGEMISTVKYKNPNSRKE